VNAAWRYYEAVTRIMRAVMDHEQETLGRAADLLVEKIAEDRLIHVFGTGGHSIMGAMEMFQRAGGLYPINAIFPPGISVTDSHPNTERLVGYAPAILDHYGVRAGDVLIIVNVNGINAVTIDAALDARRRGATVIAVTSREFASQVPADTPARHPSKQNLHDLADIVIDCHVPVGDAVLEIPGVAHKVAASSTFPVVLILNCLVALTVERMVQRGLEPLVRFSANLPGGRERSLQIQERYRGRIVHQY
jgi:uncharacterized phosphosugar-binding protein